CPLDWWLVVVVQGYNCSCFAYGHSGSGKTHSMFGTELESVPLDGAEELLDKPPAEKGHGLVPRVCYEIFQRVQELRKAASP
ncbi:unnamed protein product, partial [Discosporangium mesarthrocarpum]